MQELVAPKDVQFYSLEWKFLGSKLQLTDQLSKITNISTRILSTGEFNSTNVATRMSWAAGRQTTRVEDLAYCLMGIFEVNMPLLYGEGAKSFIRLQEEILKVSDDQSLFAWGLSANIQTSSDRPEPQQDLDMSKLHGLFADSPADFTLSHQIRILDDLKPDIPPIVTNSGVRIELPVWNMGLHKAAAISCTLEGNTNSFLCVPLFSWSERYFARSGDLFLVSVSQWFDEKSVMSLLIKAPPSVPVEPPMNKFRIAKVPDFAIEYELEEVYCLAHAKYSANDGTITLSKTQDGPHAALFFTQKHDIDDTCEEAKLNTTRRIWDRTEDEMRWEDNRDLLWISKLEIEGLSPKRTRFAIILGGDTNHFRNVWMRYINILGVDNPDRDFYSLLRRNAKLVQYCMTRDQLISSLADKELRKPFWRLRGNQAQQTIRETTASYKVSWQWIKHGRKNDYVDGRGSAYNWDMSAIVVDVELQKLPIDLVEQGIYVFIEIFLRQDGDDNRQEKPSWFYYLNSV